MLEEKAMAHFKLLSWYLFEVTNQKNENLSWWRLF
jgi:hypothetical protein